MLVVAKSDSTGGRGEINQDKTILQKQYDSVISLGGRKKLKPDVSLQLKSPSALIILTRGVYFTSAL